MPTTDCTRPSSRAVYSVMREWGLCVSGKKGGNGTGEGDEPGAEHHYTAYLASFCMSQ